MDGWEAESNAASLLNGLGIETDYHYSPDEGSERKPEGKGSSCQSAVRQSDILLLDEPPTIWIWMCYRSLEEFLINFDNKLSWCSHDRYFPNKGLHPYRGHLILWQDRYYAGNYDFWYDPANCSSSRGEGKPPRKEGRKSRELEDFIPVLRQCFQVQQGYNPGNVPWKIELDEIRPSSRKHPLY